MFSIVGFSVNRERTQGGMAVDVDKSASIPGEGGTGLEESGGEDSLWKRDNAL